MWLCRECETKNQDTDAFCACCGAKNPAPRAPRPPRTPSQNDQGPTAPQTGNGGAPAQPEPQMGQASGFSDGFAPPKKKPIPVALILVFIGIFLLACRVYKVQNAPESEYTSYSAKYDKVYADVVKMEAFSTHAWLSNEKQPTYVVCRCTRSDGSTFIMFINTSEYKRKFDKTITFKITGSFGTIESSKKLSFSPAVRIHGEVYDGSFLFGDNAAKLNVNTVLQYKSSG